MQLVDDCLDIACAGSRIQSLARLRRFALAARVHGNHAIIFREIIDLLLPNPRRYSPSRHEEQRRARRGRYLRFTHRLAADFDVPSRTWRARDEVVNLHAVARGDKTATNF